MCTRCQDTCAAPCDTCKAACAAGDKACVRKCAEARADCRGRCIKGYADCQASGCGAVYQQCAAAAAARVKGCDGTRCQAYIECIEGQQDWEKAEQTCLPKAKGLDDFCLGVCRTERSIPEYGDDAFDPPTIEDYATLTKACTPAAQCPADYRALAPYLGSFCAGTTDDASFERLAADVKRGAISKRSLSLLFNAYGAIYGYEFKKEKWMNGFFYGASAAWLPATCRAKVKSAASAKVMSFRLTKLRDRVKKLHDATP